LNADDFLSLMITQLKNQDPTKPTSTSEMLTQMTQMSTITTFDDLNKSFTSLLNMDWIGLSTSMLGKQVTYKNADDESVTGIVDSVEYVDSNVYLVVGEDKIEMTDIIGVDEASSTAETDSTTETGTESS
jgi:flagellar basal-body rod modification protein FlgD